MPAAPVVYLASASPRRRELMAQLGISCRIIATAIDESRLPGEAPRDYVRRVSLAKARDGLHRAADLSALVLAADTVVVHRGEFFGKPAGEAEAVAMLSRLSGATHEVWSGVAVASTSREATACNRSEVSFRPVCADEIAAYWASGEPRDKAGAYAIQGRGAIFVSELRGSYSGVMGLPLFETAQLLGEFGVGVLSPGRCHA